MCTGAFAFDGLIDGTLALIRLLEDLEHWAFVICPLTYLLSGFRYTVLGLGTSKADSM